MATAMAMVLVVSTGSSRLVEQREGFAIARSERFDRSVRAGVQQGAARAAQVKKSAPRRSEKKARRGARIKKARRGSLWSCLAELIDSFPAPRSRCRRVCRLRLSRLFHR